MKAEQPSSTAQAAAAVRALESLLPARERAFEDRYAASFLEPWHRGLLLACRASRLLRDSTERVLERLYPGVPGDFICRTRYIDDELKRRLREERFDRIAILGAGYDTRALRLAAGKRIPVTEVDHPATQRRKREIVESLGTRARVTWVAHDLLDPPAGLDRGFAKREKVFWIIEGVTGYLPAKRVRELLAWISDRSLPGSAIIVTYVHQEMVTGRPKDPAAKAILRYLERNDEPFLSGWTPRSIRAECARHGISLEQDLSEAECSRLYPSLRRRRLRFLSEFRIAVGTIGITKRTSAP